MLVVVVPEGVVVDVELVLVDVDVVGNPVVLVLVVGIGVDVEVELVEVEVEVVGSMVVVVVVVVTHGSHGLDLEQGSEQHSPEGSGCMKKVAIMWQI